MKEEMLRDQMKYIKLSLVFLLFVGIIPQMNAQHDVEKKLKKAQSLVRKAERAKAENDFSGAEAEYRKALSKHEENAEASYNFGHLYGDKDMEMESMSYLLRTAKHAKTKDLKHKAFHNLGNAYMAQKDYGQAVRAYEDALRNNPTDDETRYNLAIAKDMLEKNPEQDQDNDRDQDQDEESSDDQNSRENKESQDQEEQEDEGDNQQEEEQDQEEGEDEEQQAGQEEDQEQDNQDEQEEQEPQEGEMSDTQAENLLRAADNLEKDVQRKLNEKKGEKIPPKPNQKDW